MIKLFILILFFQFIFMNENEQINKFIKNTNHQYKKIKDYEVDIYVKMEVPAFRMPKKKYKVYFMQPDLIKINSKGFGILPKTGLFTSPTDNFDNLSNIKIYSNSENNNHDEIILSGKIILDSLKIEMPNEYSRLTFIPTVDVQIDTINWVIKSVITRIDTLKLFEIYNKYKFINNKYYMPIESEIKYFLKDKKVANWLNKDINSVIGDTKINNKNNEMIEGNIFVRYDNYKINQGLSKSFFYKK